MKKTAKEKKYYKFFMYLTVILLLNITGTTLFFRFDLTSNKVYSLSDASKNVVTTLSDPLTVKLFFTDNLPAPYNNIERYLHDLLLEYSIAGNRYFNYQFYNVSGEENEEARYNQEIARNYGIRPVQVQNIEQDKVKFQKAYMGITLINGDVIETIPMITSTEGLEFQITSTIRKMNNKISALLRLEKKVAVKLFLSSSLQIVGPYMDLSGLSELPDKIENVVGKLNKKNYGKLSFSYLDPSKAETSEEEAENLNILALRWKEFTDQKGQKIPANQGYAGIIVQHGEKTEKIRLIRALRIPIFGLQYQLVKMEDLGKNIHDAIENVIDINEEIGYLADHGTPALTADTSLLGQPRAESLSHFNKLLAEAYTIKPVNLNNGGIPEGLPSLIISGAKEDFSEYELYQIDQFLMQGKNLAIFIDSFDEVAPKDQRGMMKGHRNLTYLPLNTGLEKLLAHYGLSVKKSYILDENCFKQRISPTFGGGERPIYYAPLIKNEFISKEVSFLRNIKGLVMLKTSPVTVNEQKVKEYELRAHKLFLSSERSWEMSGRINLNPMFMRPPKEDTEFHPAAMAYILEGAFPSYFTDKPIPVKKESTEDDGDDHHEERGEEDGVDVSEIESEGPTLKGKPAKIFLIGTSEILRNDLLDEKGKSPNSHFVMNIIDYLNNREDNAMMRSKTQRFNPLKEVTPGTRTMIKTANIAGLPALVIIGGLIVWGRRVSRKRFIQQVFGK